MPTERGHGGFEGVRGAAEGHPMVSLLAYAGPYWRRLTIGVGASQVTRLTRLIPLVVVAVAIDRVIDAPGPPGLLATLGVVTAQPIPAESTALRFALQWRTPSNP